MIDAIGLGDAIANLIYIALLAVAVMGSVIFLMVGKKIPALIWLSISLNIVSLLYFLGTIHYVALNASVFIWPILNILLIIYYVKTRKSGKS